METKREYATGHWNYRVVRYNDPGEECYGIHIAHYKDGENKPYAITKNAVGVVAENGKELQTSLTNMQLALQKPILDYATREEISKRAAVFQAGNPVRRAR